MAIFKVLWNNHKTKRSSNFLICCNFMPIFEFTMRRRIWIKVCWTKSRFFATHQLQFSKSLCKTDLSMSLNCWNESILENGIKLNPFKWCIPQKILQKRHKPTLVTSICYWPKHGRKPSNYNNSCTWHKSRQNM